MAEQLGDISAADAAMLYDIISSPTRGPKVHDERQRFADATGAGLMMSLLSPMTKTAPTSACCKRRRKKSLAQLNETPSQREERLLKDRIRKQQSKEKFQSEIDELKQNATTLLETLSAAQAERKRKSSTMSECKSNALVERGRVQEAIATRTSLFNQVVEQVEKAVLFKSLSWRRYEGDMIIDPKRDPWQLHTLSNMHRDQHVLALAEFQREKVTPDLFSRFASSSSVGMFNFVLDDTNQHIAFLEQRKYGVIEGHYADIARTIYDAFSTTTGEGREVLPVVRPSLSSPALTCDVGPFLRQGRGACDLSVGRHPAAHLHAARQRRRPRLPHAPQHPLRRDAAAQDRRTRGNVVVL
ncbi:hypothetical protein, variant 2 [Saprolegnia diclina VS20]|uniref:Uncharacterized protein n=1 Tax=Saprolegnia diclina (strain VS20) TaxID=1156394 RepID=T0RZI5_SAPDV|nr:hypothetical protein, variant 2 [Saprolegnia diclina VS20]EQC35817.1 hypothetical protein, variant 2 [Saprolegnia diclina VS20]|eukprot:XP_008610579.1 hypothetical protein, variant 2 [Saprolegnia diclina VS20]